MALGAARKHVKWVLIGYRPALRAMHVDPIRALRYE
jgi:hypothetical protein